MTTQEIANQLISLCSQGKNLEAINTLYSADIVSVEAAAPPDGSRETKGLPGVLGKSEWWVSNHEIHSANVEGPLVTGNHFCVKFTYEVTFKPTAKRFVMTELAVYQVADGKIVREEFFYSM